MSNIKDIRCNPWYELNGRHVARRHSSSSLGPCARDPCRWPFLPWQKSSVGFYFYVCMWSCSYSSWRPFWAARAPLLTKINVSNWEVWLSHLCCNRVSGEQSPVDVPSVPKIWIVTILCRQTQDLLNQLLCVSWTLQEQFHDGCQQLQLNLNMDSE